MLVQDFDDFMENQSSARHALHCAVTAYHLYEWVWGDWLNKDYVAWKAMGDVRNKESFLAWIDTACPWFPNIQDLANGTKHFLRNQGFESVRIAGYNAAPYGMGLYGQPYLLIDFGEDASEHRFYTAGALLEVVVRFWRDFFKKYRPTIEVPVSKHHIDEIGQEGEASHANN